MGGERAPAFQRPHPPISSAPGPPPGAPHPCFFFFSIPPQTLAFRLAGYWCTGEDSCQGRAANEPQEMSSASWPDQIQGGGIFSTDPSQNPWAGANMVYIGYCSSDAWMARRPPCPALL